MDWRQILVRMVPFMQGLLGYQFGQINFAGLDLAKMNSELLSDGFMVRFEDRGVRGFAGIRKPTKGGCFFYIFSLPGTFAQMNGQIVSNETAELQALYDEVVDYILAQPAIP